MPPNRPRHAHSRSGTTAPAATPAAKANAAAAPNADQQQSPPAMPVRPPPTERTGRRFRAVERGPHPKRGDGGHAQLVAMQQDEGSRRAGERKNGEHLPIATRRRRKRAPAQRRQPLGGGGCRKRGFRSTARGGQGKIAAVFPCPPEFRLNRRLIHRWLGPLMAAGALFLAALAPSAVAQDPAPAGASTSESGRPLATPDVPATIRLHNREVVTLRANILGASPAQRREVILKRLDAVVAAKGPGTAEATRVGATWRFSVDGTAVFYLVQEDFGPLTDEQTELAVQFVQHSLAVAVREAKEMQDPMRLAKGAAYALGATLAVFALIRALFWLRRRVGDRLNQGVRRRLEKLGGRVLLAGHAELVFGALNWLTGVVTWLIVIVALDVWLSFVLQQFAYTRAWGEELTAWFIGVLQDFALAIVGAIPGLVVAALVYLLARFVTRVNSLFLQRVERGQLKLGWLDADTAAPTRRISNFIVWLFALAMAYPYLPGADTQAFKGLSVLVGLMVSLGASSIIGQALSGLSLMYARSLRQGEYVKIGETEGTVTTVGMFATKVRTGTGEEVSIPNTVIVGNPVRNFSRLVEGGAFVMHTTVTIGYATPWRQVHAMLIEAARRTRGVADEPPPYVVQTALSDYYVEYRLVAQAGAEAPQQRAQAMNDLHANIQDVFNEHGVQIMSPNYEADPEQPKIVPPEDWYRAPAQP
ncbi:MAG TPA: mechanosensitive ion channel family protein [Pelomicrobium sp.]|nr:mechanosensitive ion channel family protein [Pelomicrobium sp.]